MTSQTSEQSVEERLDRLERRQDAIIQKQDRIVEVLEQTHGAVENLAEAIKLLRPQSNDNHNN